VSELQDEGGLGGELRRKMLEGGFVLSGEVLTERESALFSLLVAKSSSSRYAPGEVIVEAGIVTRVVVLLISGTIAAKRAGSDHDGDIVDVRSCARHGLWRTHDHSQDPQSLVQDHYIGEHAFLQGCNIGPTVRLLAHTEVECLLVSHDVLELLSCNEPFVGVRFFRSLAIALGRRIERQMLSLYAEAYGMSK